MFRSVLSQLAQFIILILLSILTIDLLWTINFIVTLDLKNRGVAQKKVMKIIRGIGNKFYEEIAKGIGFIYLLKKRESKEITLFKEKTQKQLL